MIIKHLPTRKRQDGVTANAFITDNKDVEENLPALFYDGRCEEVLVDRKHC
jgi:hypothetical protein